MSNELVEMALLIDGYNVLHVSGMFGRARGKNGLEQSRQALLDFIAVCLEKEELQRTTIVFDSRCAPWGLPEHFKHHGITVLFAAKYESADDLITELIQADSAPRQLTVVSSDHAIQRAARRRRAKAMDSDLWLAHLIRQRKVKLKLQAMKPARPPVPLLKEDVEYWFRQFGGEKAFEDVFSREKEEGKKEKRPKASKKSVSKEKSNVKKPQSSVRQKKTSKKLSPPEKPFSFDNPFPPGYADDLLDEL